MQIYFIEHSAVFCLNNFKFANGAIYMYSTDAAPRNFF